MSDPTTALLVERRELKEKLKSLSPDDTESHRALLDALKRLKGRLHYYRHRGERVKKRNPDHYTKHRLRYLEKKLNAIQNLPDNQPVSLSRTAGEVRERLKSKIELCIRKLNLKERGTPRGHLADNQKESVKA